MTNHNFDLMQKAVEYIHEEDYENAYKLIKPAAENGDGDFEHMLGVFYRNGNFVEQSFDHAVYHRLFLVRYLYITLVV
jgi:TPR repeat protein